MSDEEPPIDPVADVTRWHITALGNRPIDYIGRDLMFAAQIRDPRGKRFQRLSRKSEPWMEELVAHLPVAQQRQAVEFVVLHYLHARQLHAAINALHPQHEFQRILKDVRACTPYGSLLERQTGDGKLVECKRYRFCPWCHARLVVELYEHLTANLLPFAPGQLLHQATTSIDSQDLSVFKVNIWYRHIWLANGGVPVDLAYGRLPLEVLYLNQVVRPQLRYRAGRMGIADGFTTYKVTPGLDPNKRPTFRHEIGLLGVGRCGGVEPIQPVTTFLTGARGHEFPVWWINIRGAAPSVLRLLLAGSSVSYPVDKLLEIGDMTGRITDRKGRMLPDGVPGILELPPNYLFDTDGLLQYAAATRHLRLVNRFGTWHRTGAQRKKDQEQPGEWDRVERHKKAYTRRRLKKANTKRAQSVSDRRSQLLDSARPVWPKVQQRASEACQRHGGRPPVRKVLVEMLTGLGHDVSDRDAKWLTQQLRNDC